MAHTALDRERDWDRETMGFYITLCTVHTTQGQGQGTIVFYCARPDPGPGPCPCPDPCPDPSPVQCVWAISPTSFTVYRMKCFGLSWNLVLGIYAAEWESQSANPTYQV